MASEEAIRSNDKILDDYKQEIDELKTSLPENLGLLKLPDEFLLRCLFSRDMNVAKTVTLIEHASHLHKDYEVILNLKGVNMDLLGVTTTYVSGAKTLEGHRIIFQDIAMWETSKGSYYDLNYCLTLLQGAIGWNDLSACRDGVVVVMDAAIVNFYHIKDVTLNMKSSNISATALTQYLPYSNRYNVVINASYGADLLWKGASLIMPKQMVNTMHFVRKGDRKTLSKFFSQEVIDNELYKPTAEDIAWTRDVAPRYAKYRNSIYNQITSSEAAKC